VFTGGFSAIFAYALSLLHGRFGIPGWAWIFVSTLDLLAQARDCSLGSRQIVEGAITIVFGVIAWFYLPNFPDQNGFLNEEETAYVLERVEKDRGDSVPDVLSKEKFVAHLLDWKIWAIGALNGIVFDGYFNKFNSIAGIMYMCATMPAYAIRSVTRFFFSYKPDLFEKAFFLQ